MIKNNNRGGNIMKAILILDNIDEDEIAELRANVQLNLYGEDRGEYNNCSLKPMPEKKDMFCGSSYDIIENRGYNICIDDILGEEE